MTIQERVELYKSLFPECRAIKAYKQIIIAKGFRNASQQEKIELIRELDTVLAGAYNVTIPVITFFVRDDNYVKATKEIFLKSQRWSPFYIVSVIIYRMRQGSRAKSSS